MVADKTWVHHEGIQRIPSDTYCCTAYGDRREFRRGLCRDEYPPKPDTSSLG